PLTNADVNQKEYYLLHLKGNTGATYTLNDTGISGFDELYIFGTDGADDFSLNASQVGAQKIGYVIAGQQFITEQKQDLSGNLLFYEQRNESGVPVFNQDLNGESIPVFVTAIDPVTGVEAPIERQFDATLDAAGLLFPVLIQSANPLREQVTYSGVTSLQIDTGPGNDTVFSDDNAAITQIDFGAGDDELTVGTVPLILDADNPTLEFPNGIPIADTANMTTGNSFEMIVLGDSGDDLFEVNHNSAKLFLHGGDDDDVFIVNTFLELRIDGAGGNPEEAANLTTIVGGLGNNRYQVVQDAPIKINGGNGIDTTVVLGTPLGDTFIVTEHFVAGGGTIINYTGIERLELDLAAGDDIVYVLGTSAAFETVLRTGSGDDHIHLGGKPPLLAFDPTAFTFTPPQFSVQADPDILYGYVTENAKQGSFVITGVNTTSTTYDPALVQLEDLIRNQWSAFDSLPLHDILTGAPRISPPSDTRQRALLDDLVGRADGGLDDLISRSRITAAIPGSNLSEGTTFYYEIASFERRTGTDVSDGVQVVTPAPIMIDPPPFVFEADAVFDVGSFAGRLEIDAGETFEDIGEGANELGDRLIVHNQASGADNITFASRPDPDGSATAIFGFEGLIATGRDVDVSLEYFGVEYQDLELIELRLGDFADLVSLDQLPDETKVKLILAGGNDQVEINQLLDDVEILGGAGNDSVTVDARISGGTVNDLLTFDGDAHLREELVPRTTDSLSAAQLALLNEAPLVFVNTDSGLLTNPNRQSWPSVLNLDNGQLPAGDVPFNYAVEERAPIVFEVGPGDPRNTSGLTEIWVYTDLFDPATGEKLEDLIQERGLHELGVQATQRDLDPGSSTDQLLFIDNSGDLTTTDTAVPYYITDMVAGEPLYLRKLSNGLVVKTTNPALAMRAELPSGSLAFLGPRGDFALRASDRFVTLNGSTLYAAGESVSEATRLEFVLIGGSRVAILSQNGKYVSPQQGGGGDVIVNGPAIGGWEPLDVISYGDRGIVLRTIDGTHYLRMRSDGVIDARASTLAEATVFTVSDLGIGEDVLDRTSAIPSEIGVYGTVTYVNETTTTVELPREFENPVVIAGPPSFNGGQETVVRIFNVTSNSFDITLQEPSYADNTLALETISYFVLEAGRHVLNDGTVIEVGTVETDGMATWLNNDIVGDWIDVPFSTTYASQPLLFSQLQTFNDTTPFGRYSHVVQSPVQPGGELASESFHSANAARLAIEKEEGQNGESFADELTTASFTLNGSAEFVFDNKLQLTTSGTFQAGSAWTTHPLSAEYHYSFSTSMIIDVYAAGGVGDSDGLGGDGMAFVIQSGGSSILGGAGGDLGLPWNSTPYVAIEFDNFAGGINDSGTNGSHIGIDTSSGGSLGRAFVGRYNGDLRGSDPRYVWIEYDGLSDILDVYFSESATKPSIPTLTSTVDFEAIFGSTATSLNVGFTASTGQAVNVHEVLQWNFQVGHAKETIGWLAIDPPSLSFSPRRSGTTQSGVNAGFGFGEAFPGTPTFLASIYDNLFVDAPVLRYDSLVPNAAFPNVTDLHLVVQEDLAFDAENESSGSVGVFVYARPDQEGVLGGLPLKSFVAASPGQFGVPLLWLDEAGNRLDFQPSTSLTVLDGSEQGLYAPLPSLRPVDRTAPKRLEVAELFAETSEGTDTLTILHDSVVGTAGSLTQETIEIASVDGSSVFGAGLDLSGVEALEVVLSTGNDSFQIDGTLPGTSTTVRSFEGDDTFLVSNASESLDDIVGNLNIDAGSGRNRLLVDDSGDAEADLAVTITEDIITGLAPAAISYQAVGGNFSSLYDETTGTFTPGVEVSAGSGGNVIHISSIRHTAGVIEVTRVNSGAAADTVTIANVSGYLEIDGQSGGDSLDATLTTSGITLLGGEGNDIVSGGSGLDVLVGGGGNDMVASEPEDGSGTGSVLIGDSAVIERDATYRLRRIESVIDSSNPSDGDDVILALDANHFMIGGGGSDTILGGDGNDLIFGDFAILEWSIAPSLILYESSGFTYSGTLGDDADGGDGDEIDGEGGDDFILG
ncbi:MAG: hypothetical protein JJ992_02490, partial [Planctomycetes bacterium]|nr:hypothetical protein [Planctomycetota bacterium]